MAIIDINGIWVLDEDIHIKSGVKITGRLDNDRAFLDIVCPFIRPGSVALDIGANIGTHSFAYLKTGAEIYSFEPNPETFSCLVHNCPKTHAFNVALGNEHKKIEQWIPQEDSGMSFLCLPGNLGDPNAARKELITVKMVTLDSIYESNAETWDRLGISYAKIDTEGSEPLVLQGARKTLKRFRPVLVIEMCYNTLGRLRFTGEDVLRPLAELNYRVFDLPIESPHRHDPHWMYNLLAVPRLP